MIGILTLSTDAITGLLSNDYYGLLCFSALILGLGIALITFLRRV